ncbi:hypothetical protein BS47DRAFT_1299638, partial [Hydnum rufescens UP504]
SAVLEYAQGHVLHEPYHTSSLTGEKWLSEMLAHEAHPEQIHDQLGMHKHIF